MARAPWPMFRGDPARTGRGAAALPERARLRWSVRVGGAVLGSPVIGPGGTIVIASDDGFVRALDRDGRVRWATSVGARAGSPAIAPDGGVLVGTRRGALAALGPDGSRRWTHGGSLDPFAWLRGGLVSSPVVRADGTVLVVAPGGTLRMLGPEGLLRWSRSLPGPGVASPAIAPDGTIWVHHERPGRPGALRAFAPDGTEVRAVELPPARPRAHWPPVVSTPAIADDGTILVGGGDAALHAVGRNGELLWSTDLGTPVGSSPALAPDGTVYAGTDGGALFALERDGRVRWQRALGELVESSPAAGADGKVVVGGSACRVLCLRPDGSRAWAVRTRGSIPGSPAIDEDGTVYAGDSAGFLHAIEPDPVRPARRPPAVGAAVPALREIARWAGPHRLAAGPAPSPDGGVVIVDGAGAVLRLSPGAQLEWRVPVGPSGRVAACVAPDGTTHVSRDGTVILALDAGGARLWRWRTWRRPSTGFPEPVSAPVAGPGVVLFSTSAGPLVALDREGLRRFRIRRPAPSLGGPYPAPVFLSDGSIVAGTSAGPWDARLAAFSPEGAPRWSTWVGHALTTPALPLPDGSLRVGARSLQWLFDGEDHCHGSLPEDHVVCALDAAGRVRWDAIVEGPSSGPLADGGGGDTLVAVTVALTEGVIFRLGPDGSVVHRVSLGAPARSGPVPLPGGAAAVAGGERVVTVSAGGNVASTEPLGAPLVGLAAGAEGRLVAATAAGAVVWLELRGT